MTPEEKKINIYVSNVDTAVLNLMAFVPSRHIADRYVLRIIEMLADMSIEYTKLVVEVS